MCKFIETRELRLRLKDGFVNVYNGVVYKSVVGARRLSLLVASFGMEVLSWRALSCIVEVIRASTSVSYLFMVWRLRYALGRRYSPAFKLDESVWGKVIKIGIRKGIIIGEVCVHSIGLAAFSAVAYA